MHGQVSQPRPPHHQSLTSLRLPRPARPPLALARLAIIAATNGLRRNIPATVANLTGGEYFKLTDAKSLERSLVSRLQPHPQPLRPQLPASIPPPRTARHRPAPARRLNPQGHGQKQLLGRPRAHIPGPAFELPLNPRIPSEAPQTSATSTRSPSPSAQDRRTRRIVVKPPRPLKIAKPPIPIGDLYFQNLAELPPPSRYNLTRPPIPHP